jgi:hypothetical protein
MKISRKPLSTGLPYFHVQNSIDRGRLILAISLTVAVPVESSEPFQESSSED